MPAMTLQQAIDLATQRQRGGQLPDAEAICRQVLAQQPGNFPALELLAQLRHQQHDPAGAEELLRHAIRLAPQTAHLHGNLGMVLALSGRIDEAITAFDQAIALNPAMAETHNNLANALREKGRYQDAIASYRRALLLKPDYPDAQWNLGLILLLQGDFEQGLPLYEARRRVGAFGFQPQLHGPQWDGSDPAGRTILLQGEQGFGDTIQFVRYASMAVGLGARVLLQAAPELTRLLSGQCGIETVMDSGQSPPAFDASSPLLSLPLIFGTTRQTIPGQTPYLQGEPALIEQWRRRLSSQAPGLKVGLSWAGRTTHPGDRNRSLAPSLLAPLGQLHGIHFYSLQKWKPAGKDPLPIDLTNWTDELADFADTAALIANLDLVIAADTAVAHLAGALGKPVWTLLPFVPDWRWMLDRTDSPWYPSMRLFRQPAPGDWKTPLEQAAAELRNR